MWLDAGVTVLRPLDDFVDQATEIGYFLVSTGVPTALSTPSAYYNLYDLAPDFGNQVSVTSGILAFRRGSAFYEQVIEPTFLDVTLGRNLGFSADETTKLNSGLDAIEEPTVHDCPLFRFDQTVFNIRLYRAIQNPRVREIEGDHDPDLYKYAGCRSPHDHPQQVIWNHRRSGDFRFLPRVRYMPKTAALGLPWGLGVYLMSRARHYRWLIRPAVYAHVGRRLFRERRLRAER